MFVNGTGRNEQTLYRVFHRCFLPSFASFSQAVSEEKIFKKSSQAVSEEKIFKKSTNQKPELSVAAMFVNGSGRNERSLQRTLQRCFQRSYDSIGQTVSENKKLKNQPIRNKNRLWWPCLLTDRDELNNLYRGLSIDASYQVLVHLAKWFQRRRFLKIGQSLRNKNCL
jgi:hypothetical protein